MGPFTSKSALRNLQRSIRQTEKNLSAAARVRREFRSGRPPKSTLPLHPSVVWQKAEGLLADFRAMMESAGLSPSDVESQIIAVKADDVERPIFISLADRDAAIRTLSDPDTIALGSIFRQHDAALKQSTDFFVQYVGVSPAGLALLKRAVEIQNTITGRPQQ